MRSDNWPSPHRSQRSAPLRLRPREEGRCFFAELVLHPQPADFVFHFFHAGALPGARVRNGLRVITPPQVESGSPGEFHPRAPTEPCVTVSRHTALLI